MLLRKLVPLLAGLTCLPAVLLSQRSYRPASVLSAGSYYKISVREAGIYKIDLPLLSSLGINTSSLASASVRLYGNGGQMLPENNAAPYADDLRENAMQAVDGGDGIINGSDYLLFYAPGPDEWLKDSINRRFSHRKNLYSDKSYYFLTIGGTGLRVPDVNSPGPASVTITSFDEHYFHELDTVNFLSSGREWYGEEFANSPGKVLTRNFPVSVSNLLPGNIQLQTSCAARSLGAGSSFNININAAPAGQLSILPIGSGPYDPFGQQSTGIFTGPATQDAINIGYTFNPGSFNAQGWLNWFEVFVRRSLNMNGTLQLPFRDWQSVGNFNGSFIINNATAGLQVWDVTNSFAPERMQGNLSGNTYQFVNDCSRLREYVAFGTPGLLVPVAEGRVAVQNLHAGSPVDLLLITHQSLLPQAERLAQLHRQHDNLRVLVVTTQQVYNEFSSGSPDPAALRDFIKMYYDRYRNDPASKPKYVLLFGDASFDYKDRLANNTNLVPAYESSQSLDILSTYVSDDFFGFLDDNADINNPAVTNYLQVGIGRIPAHTPDEAKNVVDKIEVYLGAQSLGPWRNNLTFIADDEDNNLHLQDAEIIAATSATANPVFNQQKIYLDAYRQESGSGGSGYPQANDAINNQVYNGTLVWNYTGHGGPRRLAEETVIDQDIVNNWNNPTRLPLFITATCDFAPYDIPGVNSLGENILLRPKTGAIALMTTTRVVFAYSNRVMNTNYLRIALARNANGEYLSLGDAIRESKNYTYQNSSDITNNRKFTLLGDPALTLAFPQQRVNAVRINGRSVAQPDTLHALQRVVIEGEVTDRQGNLLSDFNGTVYPAVYDKLQSINTLGNDAGSPVTSFITQQNILFKGKASVAGGKYSFTFKVPKDINYQYGNGRLSLYADNGTRDGNGSFTGFFIGGAALADDNDKEGPRIKSYLNDESFVNGELSNENPVLIVNLEDSSGINTAGTGIGHDIVATLDDDNRQIFVLNDFYQGELDSYQKGSVRFQMPVLTVGLHTLRIKAWDVLNNSNEMMLDFVVAKDEDLVITHVLNYPNPFTTRTQFWFEHNKPGQDLQVRIQIFTVSGRVIKMIEKTINTIGNRSSELEWDGRDEYGQKPGRGVYLYKLSVTAPGRQRKEKIEKLVVF